MISQAALFKYLGYSRHMYTPQQIDEARLNQTNTRILLLTISWFCADYNQGTY